MSCECFAAGRPGALNITDGIIRKECGNIKATCQDTSQEAKSWAQMGLPNGQCPSAFGQSNYKVARRQQGQCFVMIIKTRKKN